MEPGQPVGDPTERVLVAVEQKTGRARKRAGREWKLICPAHEDHQPSLNVREGDAGYPIIVCRSHGCTPAQVLESVGLAWSDIFESNDHWTPHGDAIAHYSYVDENGKLLFQVLRTAGKEFPCRRPDASRRSGWAWNMGDRKVIYRLPEVIEAVATGVPIYIIEGEKAVDTIERLGHVATCAPGGAGKWRREYAEWFRGAHVIVVGDLDKVGREHARTVAASLHGVAEIVELLEPATGVEHNGVDDHLAAGLTLEQLQPLSLEAVESDEPAVLIQPPDSAAAQEVTPDSEPAPPRLRFLPGPEFIEQELAQIDPLVGTSDDALMMPGSLVIMAGVGGSGKTTLAMHAMAHWGAGVPWFGIPTPRALRMIVIENEGPHDPYVNKVKEFAQRWNNCPCCATPHGDGTEFLKNCLFLDSPWGHFTFEDPGLATELGAAVKDFGADLVIANPLGRLGMRGAGTPEETRAFLKLLFDAGLNTEFAALLLHHMSKVGNPKQTPIVQQLSGDWGPHPDTILVLENAGERQGKLEFGKVRWGDQGRAPLLLEWLTDPEGPVGYRVEAAPQGISDSELYTRIDTFLVDFPASNMTTIRKRVQGNARRIGELVGEGVTAGRYMREGEGRKTFYSVGSGEPVIPATQEELEWR